MAFFRCGGGGLPTGLQSDMDAVLNKKFSTSTTYLPTDWAPTVNLLGPLPEKTASGAIANITDGADGVPVKNWLVTLPASLTGYSSIVGTKSGKNLCKNNLSTENVNGVDITIGTDGTITLDGTATARITRSLYTNFELKAGTYTLSCGTSSLPLSCYLNLNGGGQSVSCTINTPSKSFTLEDDSTITYIRIDLANGSVLDNLKLYPMLEVGSTETAYEAYEAPTTYTASLGRTIYGGQADIVTGEGEDENGNTFTFTPITPTPETALGVNNFLADEGDSSVTYRADIDLLLGGN